MGYTAHRGMKYNFFARVKNSRKFGKIVKLCPTSCIPIKLVDIKNLIFIVPFGASLQM